MYEETWDAFPDTKTILNNGYVRLKGKFNISIHTLHLPGPGTEDNPHNRSDEQWDEVDIVQNDFISEDAGDGDPNHDPRQFQSTKTGRGKLSDSWVEEALHSMAKNASKVTQQDKFGVTPLMCCYTLVEVNFKVFGLQVKVEKILQKSVQQILKTHYRALFCSIDDWYDLNFSQICDILQDKEKYKMKEDIEEAFKKLQIKG